jgi:CDP-diacylglycerol--glycerol-3-phosphate 3-phosphatidyltransferase
MIILLTAKRLTPKDSGMAKTWQQRLPMQITMSRIGMVPIIVACMWPNQLPWSAIAAALFLLTSASDYFDGYYARKFNAVSTMGKFMDPIADKILVTSILVMLVQVQKIDPLMVIVILARDTFIGGIRSIAATDGIIIDAKPTGKWKTALQMVAIPAVMIDQKYLDIPFDKIGYGVLWISVVLSVTSGLQYFWAYRQGTRSKSSQSL